MGIVILIGLAIMRKVYSVNKFVSFKSSIKIYLHVIEKLGLTVV